MKTLAAKPDGPSSAPGTHMVDREQLQVVLSCVSWCVHMYTGKISKYFKTNLKTSSSRYEGKDQGQAVGTISLGVRTVGTHSRGGTLPFQHAQSYVLA